MDVKVGILELNCLDVVLGGGHVGLGLIEYKLYILE